MSDRHLSSHLSSLDPDLATLLCAERDVPAAPSGAKERVLGRIAVTVGLAGAGLGAASGAAHAASTAATTNAGRMSAVRSPLFKLGLSCLVGAAVGGTIIYLLMRHDRAPVATLVETPSRRPSAREIVAPHFEVVPRMAPAVDVDEAKEIAPPMHPHHAVIAVPSDGAEPGLEEERKLLDGARSAIAVGRIDRALSAISLHSHRFPHGQLVEERETLLIHALSASGKSDEARARGRDFYRRFPASIFRPAVDASLQALSPR